MHNRSNDNNFMFKIFNTLEILNNKDFLPFIKKNRNLWKGNELEDNMDILILVCTKKYNNLKKLITKKTVTKSYKNNSQEIKCIALLTQLIPILLKMSN